VNCKALVGPDEVSYNTSVPFVILLLIISVGRMVSSFVVKLLGTAHKFEIVRIYTSEACLLLFICSCCVRFMNWI